LVLGVAIGAAALLASALAFAQPHGGFGGHRGGGAYAGRPAAPAFRPAAPVYRPAPAVRQFAPAYRPAAPIYRQPAIVHRPQPAYRPFAPAYRPYAPAYRPVAPAWRHPVQPRYHRPHYRPYPAYNAYPVYRTYPVAPVWQDWPGQAVHGCVWKKRRVWTPVGLRIKWRQVCY
jgi:hypothetical protein